MIFTSILKPKSKIKRCSLQLNSLSPFHKILFAGLIFTLLTLLSGCKKGEAAGGGEEKKETGPIAVELALASIRPMETTLAAQGTLSPGQGAAARVSTTVAGRLLSVLVKEGDHVNAGDLLAVVDNRVGQAQARSAAAALTASQALARQSEIATRALAADQSSSVRLATLTLQSAQLDRDNAVQSAQTALQTAETDLQRIRAGARPQEIAQAEGAVAQARATRDRAQTEVERVQFLNEKGIAPLRQLNDAQTALAVSNAALESALQASSLLRAGARAEDLKAAELRLRASQQTLAQAKSSGDAKIGQARASLRQARQSALQVDAKRQEFQAARESEAQKKADYAAAQTSAQASVIRAPISGIVTKRTLNPGDSADAATPILEITDPRALNLIASLPASASASLKPGMEARITSLDVPGKTFPGRVLSVGQVDPQTNLLTLRISVLNAQGELKPGAFASADLLLRREPKAVVVPKAALLSKEGKSVVFVVDKENAAHQKEVTPGAAQGDFVEILKGVAAGEQVIRLGQYELADGAKVKPVEEEKAVGDDKKDEKKPEGDAAKKGGKE